MKFKHKFMTLDKHSSAADCLYVCQCYSSKQGYKDINMYQSIYEIKQYRIKIA